MFGSLGITELILILVIVLVIFGAGKLPQLGEGIGKAIRGFKKSTQELDPVEPEVQAAQQPTASASQQTVAQPAAQVAVTVEQPAAPVHAASRG
jgi:sec-independent protein translocase protein TatA